MEFLIELIFYPSPLDYSRVYYLSKRFFVHNLAITKTAAASVGQGTFTANN